MQIIFQCIRDDLIKRRASFQNSCIFSARAVILAWKQWNFNISHVFNLFIRHTTRNFWLEVWNGQAEVWISNCGGSFSSLFFSFSLLNSSVNTFYLTAWNFPSCYAWVSCMICKKSRVSSNNNIFWFFMHY